MSNVPIFENQKLNGLNHTLETRNQPKLWVFLNMSLPFPPTRSHKRREQPGGAASAAGAGAKAIGGAAVVFVGSPGQW